jgi:ornithine carbamoyltransferase
MASPMANVGGHVDHFLTIADTSTEDLQRLLDLAIDLKEERMRGGNRPILAGKSLGMIFEKPSLRTRVSFEMAMVHVGGYALYLSPNEIGLGKRESLEDIARVLSRYVDCIMARVFAHSTITGLAGHSRVPVINGLSDYEHPCQALGDMLTIQEKRGKLQGLKLAYVGDGNNVSNSLLFFAARFGMHFAIASPPGYTLTEEVVELGRALAEKTGARVDVTEDPAAAVKDADAIYTDVWTSMGQEAEREQRLAVFPPYQLNSALLRLAPANVLVMHCLPAHRGEEITDEVADGPNSVLFDQAENRLHAQKSVLATLLA